MFFSRISLNKIKLMASWTRVSWKPKTTSHLHNTRFLFTKSFLKGKEKRRYNVHVFWMESFRSTDMLSCGDNGPGPPCCVLPAPRPPPFAISLSPSEQKHTVHPARNNTPRQKFTSCAPALLLRTDPVPKTCITSPPHTQMALGHTSGKTSSPSNAPLLEAIFKPCTHRTVWPLSLLFPPAQNRSDRENTCENMRVLF